MEEDKNRKRLEVSDGQEEAAAGVPDGVAGWAEVLQPVLGDTVYALRAGKASPTNWGFPAMSSCAPNAELP